MKTAAGAAGMREPNKQINIEPDRLGRKASASIHKMLMNSVDWVLYFEPQRPPRPQRKLMGSFSGRAVG
jgi:hypothetical protein